MSNPTASSAGSDLIQQLMPLRSDPGKLCEALASFDMALVGEAFAELLAVAASDEGIVGKVRKLINTFRNANKSTFNGRCYLNQRCYDVAVGKNNSFVSEVPR